MIVKLPGTVTNYRDKVDGSSTINIASRELTDEEILILRRLRGAEGWFLFSSNEIKEEDIPKEEAPIEGKSHSQRLYNSLFVLYKEKNIPEDFETWRRMQMEKIINYVKSQIDEMH